MLDPQQRLRNAIIEGNLPITKRLLARFPELWLNPDPSHDGWTNLHYASFHGHYLICFHLVSFMNQNMGVLSNHYSHLDLLTFDNLLVLHLSLLTQKPQTLHYLLQEFPGKLWLNYAGGRLNQTPAHYSCIYGFKEGIKLLLEFGADWKLQDLDGNTCLHLCLEFGNFDCIQVILKYLMTVAPDRKTCVDQIRKFELTKNNKGWTAIEYASSFDLISKYEVLKHDLLFDAERAEVASVLKTPNQLFSLEHNSSQTSLPGNKVLASPIVPVSQAQKGEEEPTKSDSEISPSGRAHSLSLPSSSTPEIKPTTSASRRRAQTSYSYKPPASINANLNSPRSNVPQTPSNRAPSLKSFTISPSIRSNNYDDNDNFLPPPSPQSTISNSSSLTNSPTNIAVLPQMGRKKSLSFSNAPFHEPTSSIAAKVAFNSSRSSLESPVRRPSLSNRSSSGGGSAKHSSGDISPVLRKTKSSGTLPVNGSHSSLNKSSSTTILEQPPLSIPRTASPTKAGSLTALSRTSLKGASNDNLKRGNISSISFSRVR
ncbi:ankyrin [Suhomyces tanzawaensis NRRL Y-17324]|uniref:Ankyrin n=1 Tax=Suhomyces tanzawaensis NRRL Y-17324 TaxID=984487 RepID=A0A1E4SS49_9ASCO|nr:ankyrin [Suhomyces tanzawaensis NRRL Y-17324]ODV82334.1 ankyrin [Suhomyces tanzawaensis NRRL Y-17324]